MQLVLALQLLLRLSLASRSIYAFRKAVKAEDAFAVEHCEKKGCHRPTLLARLSREPELHETIEMHLQGVRTLMHQRTWQLLDSFIDNIMQHGSPAMQTVYENMSVEALVHRLLTKRPVVLDVTDGNRVLLPRDLKQHRTDEELDIVLLHEKDAPRSLLEEYLTRDEYFLASLLVQSTPALFASDCDDEADRRHFEATGIVMAIARPVLDLPGFLDHSTFFATEKHSLIGKRTLFAKLLGLHQVSYGKLVAHAKRHGIQPTEEFETGGERFCMLTRHVFFNVNAYQRRMWLVLAPALHDASMRGHDLRQSVLFQINGLDGITGVAKLHQEWFIDTVTSIVKASRLPAIHTINYSRLDIETGPFSVWDADGHEIVMDFVQRAPAEKLREGWLLVTTYARSPLSLPGEGSWLARSKRMTDEVRFAKCSTAPAMINPYINVYLDAETIVDSIVVVEDG